MEGCWGEESKSYRSHGWIRSSRSPEDKMVKNTSLGGYRSLRKQEEEKRCSDR